MTDMREDETIPEDSSPEESSFEDLAAVLKQEYAGSDVDVDFSRELLSRLEAELDQTASAGRATARSAVHWRRWSLAAAGLAACVTIGLTFYFGVFYEPPRREARPVDRGSKSRANARGPQNVALRGVVVSESGEPVEGARVINLGGGRVPGGVVSGADGTFDLPIGRPIIGYESVVATSADGALIGIHNGAQTAESSRARTNSVPLRIVLKPAHALRVRVRDAGDGPVDGATVEFIHRSHLTAQARTDAAGVATLHLPRDMGHDWRVHAFKPGLGFDYEVFESPVAGEEPREVDLVLDGARTVFLRAVGTTGEPLPDALFFPNRIHKRGKTGPAHLSTFAGERQASLVRTGQDGRARLDWLPPVKELVEVPGVRLDLPGAYYLPRHLERLMLPTGDAVEITLWRQARLSGVVRGANGRPAAGILIRAEGLSDTDPRKGRGVARTAGDGSYVMDLPPNHFYMLAVNDDLWAAPAQTGILLREDELREGVDFRLAEGTLIHGRVTDRSSSPVLGQSVNLHRYGDDLPEGFGRGERGLAGRRQSLQVWTTTDSQGYYAFRVGPGDYVVSVGSRTAEIVVGTDLEIVQDFEV